MYFCHGQLHISAKSWLTQIPCKSTSVGPSDARVYWHTEWVSGIRSQAVIQETSWCKLWTDRLGADNLWSAHSGWVVPKHHAWRWYMSMGSSSNVQTLFFMTNFCFCSVPSGKYAWMCMLLWTFGISSVSCRSSMKSTQYGPIPTWCCCFPSSWPLTTSAISLCWFYRPPA